MLSAQSAQSVFHQEVKSEPNAFIGEDEREVSNMVLRHQDLEVYKVAFEAAMQVFGLSKGFPKEETYSLTDQIRRSSRSGCANRSVAQTPL